MLADINTNPTNYDYLFRKVWYINNILILVHFEAEYICPRRIRNDLLKSQLRNLNVGKEIVWLQFLNAGSEENSTLLEIL